MTQKVYIITQIEYQASFGKVKGVFSTDKKAVDFMRDNRVESGECYCYSCDSYIVDDPALVKVKEETLTLTGAELRARFIGTIENAGFNPYVFSLGLITDLDNELLTKEQCIALGMSEVEFEARSQRN